MAYRVQIKAPALKSLKKISEPDQSRIMRRIDALAEDPRPAGVKKLQGADDLYRLRLGDYRVIYQVQDDILLVLVVRVGHRKEIYRQR
jgi:mRNA interferase RelE/StbE